MLRNSQTREPIMSIASLKTPLNKADTGELTLEQVAVVQQSFAKVAPIADRAAVMFYDRLFEIAPQVKGDVPG
jgi:hypothetical protein